MDYSIFEDMSSISQEQVNQLLTLVPDFRREQALRFRHVFGQYCCLKSWLMWREMMAPYIDEDQLKAQWLYNPYNKPYLPDALFFSISHCRTGIAVAVSSQQVGIDIESVRRADESLIAYTMNKEEQALIHASNDMARAFTKLWTMKEAYLKAIGTGIQNHMQDVLLNADSSLFQVKETTSYICSIYARP